MSEEHAVKNICWVRCSKCAKKIAKRMKPGLYEVSHRISGKSRVKVEIISGTITCPKCRHAQSVLDIPESSFEEEVDGETKCQKI